MNPALDIIFEDDYFLVINKPSGVHSVMQSESVLNSIAASLLMRDVQLAEVSSKADDAGLVNRLDFETSGILLAAKTREAWIKLRAILLSEAVEKNYLALVEGKPDEHQIVEAFIGSSYRRASKVRVFGKKPRKKERALPARTEIDLITHYPELDCSLVRASAHLARRHQIRAHAKYSGHSLVGDEAYGSSRVLSKVLGFEAPKFFLHAERVRFKHPFTDARVDITTLVPSSIRKALNL